MLVVALLQAAADTSLPMDKGLPVLVKVAVAFVDISGFNENTGNFKATVDVGCAGRICGCAGRPRKSRDPPKVYRGAEALGAASPHLDARRRDIANQVGEASRTEARPAHLSRRPRRTDAPHHRRVRDGLRRRALSVRHAEAQIELAMRTI